MTIIQRQITPVLLSALKRFPAVVMTGPRRAGKTTLLRMAAPQARYVLLEDPDVQDRVQRDPRGFLEGLRPPVIFDEIQHTPQLLNYVRTLVDAHPRRMGQWLFTGSQEAPLMQGITESMAGRAAILQLLPFSMAETPKADPLLGGFPEVVLRPKGRELWYASYLQTYLERDVRSITSVRDLAVFRRFLSLLASRHGQTLNRVDLAAPLGVSVPTVSEWLRILEITNQVILVPPYFENFGKRLVKSPKVYWGDAGLACHLLGIQTQAELDRSPFLGPDFRGIRGSGDPEGAGQPWQAQGTVFLPRSAGTRGGFSCSAPECALLGGGGEGREDGKFVDGGSAHETVARGRWPCDTAHSGASQGANAD